MPIAPKVLQLAQREIAADLARIHREHLEELREIARDTKRHGNHLRSRTHGRSIFDEICKTYQQRAEAIHEAIAGSLRFQDGQPFTTDELAHTFEQLFEPERSKVLEYSRQRLAEIRDGSFINDTVIEASRLIAWFRVKAEHIVANHRAAPAPNEASGATQNTAVTSDVPVTEIIYEFARVHAQADIAKAAEVSRELDQLHSILPTITDPQLSAYSTKSLSIAAFLHHKGHAFSVLTEDMFAEQFREEMERRKAARRDGWRSTLTSPLTLTAIIGAVVGVITLIANCSGAS